MKDISLHVLDIVQNSISAKATLIEVAIKDLDQKNEYTVTIKDNGKGIPPDILETITDPWTTTRRTRKVGLGIPLFKQNAELTGGTFQITSEINKGTQLCAQFINDHIDRLPSGDLSGVYLMLVTANPKLEFVFSHQTDCGEFVFDTREVKQILGDVSLNESSIRTFLKEMLQENIQELYQKR